MPNKTTGYAFISLLRDAEDALGLSRLLDDLRAPNATTPALFLCPEVIGLRFFADPSVEDHLNIWWQENVPGDAFPVYLFEHEPGLEEWAGDTDGHFYIGVTNSMDEQIYAALSNVTTMRYSGPLDLATAVMRDYSVSRDGLEPVFEAAEAERMGKLAPEVTAAMSSEVPQAEAETTPTPMPTPPPLPLATAPSQPDNPSEIPAFDPLTTPFPPTPTPPPAVGNAPVPPSPNAAQWQRANPTMPAQSQADNDEDEDEGDDEEDDEGQFPFPPFPAANASDPFGTPVGSETNPTFPGSAPGFPGTPPAFPGTSPAFPSAPNASPFPPPPNFPGAPSFPPFGAGAPGGMPPFPDFANPGTRPGGGFGGPFGGRPMPAGPVRRRPTTLKEPTTPHPFDLLAQPEANNYTETGNGNASNSFAQPAPGNATGPGNSSTSTPTPQAATWDNGMSSNTAGATPQSPYTPPSAPAFNPASPQPSRNVATPGPVSPWTTPPQPVPTATPLGQPPPSPPTDASPWPPPPSPSTPEPQTPNAFSESFGAFPTAASTPPSTAPQPATPKPLPPISRNASASGATTERSRSFKAPRLQFPTSLTWPLKAWSRKDFPESSIRETAKVMTDRGPTVVVMGSRKGGVGKTSYAAGVAIVAGTVLGSVGHKAAIVDANIANPDAWGQMNLREGAATVREVVAALTSNTEPPLPVHAGTPALACFPEAREATEYSRTDVQRFADYLRRRYTLIVVDMSNRLPDPMAGPEAAAAAYWLEQADILVLPTTSAKQDFNGVLDYLDVRGLPPVVVPYIIPGKKKNREHPVTQQYLAAIRDRVHKIVEIPDEADAVRYASMEGVPVEQISPSLAAAYRQLTEVIVRAPQRVRP